MKRKIIFFHLYNNYSGSPRVLLDVISVVKNKYDITLITSKTDGVLSNLDVKKKLIPYNWTKNKILTLFKFIYAQLCFVFYAFFLAKKGTIFYINTQQPSVVGLVGKLLNVPVVFHVHESSSSQKYFGKFYRLIRECVNGHEIFVSQFIKEVEEVNKDKSHVIYNSTSKKIFNESLNYKYSPIKSDVFNVLMICSLRDYKGIPELFRVATLLLNEEKIKFKLVVDASEKDIEEYFNLIIKPKNITIYSRTTNPEIYFKQSSLVLNLSRVDQWIETFGLTILEALNFGIPCIVPPVGGPIEIIDDGVNGYCISSYDVDIIASKIKDLSRDSEKCKQLSKQAKIKSEFFSQKKFKNHIIEFLSNK